MTRKVYVIEIDNKNIRTIFTDELIHVGSIIEDDVWLGVKIKGGKVTKIFR